ncbi:MAG TPA: VWA domain-containing protein [Terriglobia bacterium]|jgi:VWFA-related protein
MLLRAVLSAFLLFQFTISVDVDLAVFNITVLGNDGKPVTGLTADSFKIFEDGREEKIKIFQPEDTPATVGLLIDNSGSMTNKRRDVVEAALAFIDASHPDDEMFIVDFNRRAWLALPTGTSFTSDRSLLRATLTETRSEGTTALYDAMELALNHLKDGARQRKALVILSDGGDNSSHIRQDDALKMAEQSSATIYSIGIYDPFQKDRNPGVLKKIAKVTGGESYFPSSLTEMRAIWPRIAGAIRGQYTIGYMSSNQAKDGTFRKVKIVAKNKRGKMLDVRARPGYVSGEAPK